MRTSDFRGCRWAAVLPSICVVRAHEQKLANVLDNLVGNAIKFTPEGGRVALSVGWRRGGLVIAVLASLLVSTFLVILHILT